MIPASEWQWFGQPGHFILSDYCHHHLCTRIGDYLVSTVGDFRPNSPDSPQREIGVGRLYETYVFNVKDALLCDETACGCVMPVKFERREIDSLSASNNGEADANHAKMCAKYAAIGGEKS